ncbi:hypothetical protein Pmani_018230 [Petrolisthes manimaculis]|uniref:Reverse transcriptase domain-containing protein n=1 Tax=Petrolisthes manimaculis TaxID=1843537 RepID=A0AAE1PKU6_9EUCA|nr:hypothetical protein Pmani_018230 [Petrolisthes manimaculis]
MDLTSLATAIPDTFNAPTPIPPMDVTIPPTSTSATSYTHCHTTALAEPRLLHVLYHPSFVHAARKCPPPPHVTLVSPQIAILSDIIHDILVDSHTHDQHRQHLRELCDCLQQYGLKIHPSK